MVIYTIKMVFKPCVAEKKGKCSSWGSETWLKLVILTSINMYYKLDIVWQCALRFSLRYYGKVEGGERIMENDHLRGNQGSGAKVN